MCKLLGLQFIMLVWRTLTILFLLFLIFKIILTILRTKLLIKKIFLKYITKYERTYIFFKYLLCLNYLGFYLPNFLCTWL